MSNSLAVLPMLAATAAIALPALAQAPHVGVMIGDSDHDACSVWGVVDGLEDTDGDKVVPARVKAAGFSASTYARFQGNRS
jgi:hypothetical protein